MSRWNGFSENDLRELSEALAVATVKHEGSQGQHELRLEVDGELASRDESVTKTHEVSQQAKEGSLVRVRTNIRPKYLQGALLEVKEIIAGRLHCEVVDKASLRGKKFQGGVVVRPDQVEMELA